MLIFSWFFRLKQGLFHLHLNFPITFFFFWYIFFDSTCQFYLIPFFDCSILLKLNKVLNFLLHRSYSLTLLGLIPYFSFFTLFIFSADCFTIVDAGIFALGLSNMAFNFDILLFISLILCFATNAFPPLKYYRQLGVGPTQNEKSKNSKFHHLRNIRY